MQVVPKTDTVATRQEAYFYARVAAAVDFVNSADKNLWRKHVQQQHESLFPWRKDINEESPEMG